MAMQSRLRSWRERVRSFASAKGGNVAMMFGLLAIPIVGLVGSAVDYSRANSAKAAMQSAADATALMLSKQAANLTTSEIASKATSYFNALFNRTDVNNVSITPTYTTTGGSQVVITATGAMPTTILKAIGFANFNIDVASTVKWGNTRLRVALVLDNTGSMSSAGKLAALKTATTSLLGQLQTAAAKDGDVYVSIIPFVKDVAVDPTTNVSANWIDWTDWDAEPQVLDTNKSGSKPSNWAPSVPARACPFTSNLARVRLRVERDQHLDRIDHSIERQHQGLDLPGYRQWEEAQLEERRDVQRLLHQRTCGSTGHRTADRAHACPSSSNRYVTCSCSGKGKNKTLHLDLLRYTSGAPFRHRLRAPGDAAPGTDASPIAASGTARAREITTPTSRCRRAATRKPSSRPSSTTPASSR